MLKLFKLLIVLALVGGVVAYCRGWINLNIGIDSKKVNEDLKDVGADGLVGPIAGTENNGLPTKDDMGMASGKEDRPAGPAKDDRTPPAGKSDRVIAGPKKDDKSASPVKEERAEGIVREVVIGLPRFTVQLIDGRTMTPDKRYLTFDMAPKSEIRVNDNLSDFRAIRPRAKVAVTYYQEADSAGGGPPRNMARLVVIERSK